MQSEVTILNEQVKYLMKDNQTLKQALDGAEAAVQKHKIDYTDSQVRRYILNWQFRVQLY